MSKRIKLSTVPLGGAVFANKAPTFISFIMYPSNKYKIFDWIGHSLCVLIPVFGVLVLQEISASELTVDALELGRWWTLWSGHVLHFTLDHLVWDALMFVIFSALLWPKEGWRMWLWLFAAAPIISLFVFSVEPDLYEYRGLSALDTMLCVRFFVEFFKCNRAWPRWILGVLPLLGLSLKIGYELTVGKTLFVTDLGAGVVPLPSAHLVGLVLGLLWGIWRTSLYDWGYLKKSFCYNVDLAE